MSARRSGARVSKIVGEIFGLAELRPGQRAVIDAVLAKRHTLAIMPTGAGKSLCYQVPAMLMPGMTVVVSPLIALMRDLSDGGHPTRPCEDRAPNGRVRVLHDVLPLPNNAGSETRPSSNKWSCTPRLHSVERMSCSRPLAKPWSGRNAALATTAAAWRFVRKPSRREPPEGHHFGP
jgi:hypothetical protein